MIKKIIELCDGDEIDLMSFISEFNIDRADFDVGRLKIVYDQDWSGVYYDGDQPVMAVEISYDEEN